MMTAPKRKRGRPLKAGSDAETRARAIHEACEKAQRAIDRTRPCRRYAARILREVAESGAFVRRNQQNGAAGHAELRKTASLVNNVFYWANAPQNYDLWRLFSILLADGENTDFRVPGRFTDMTVAIALSYAEDPTKMPSAAALKRLLEKTGIPCDWATAKNKLSLITPEVRANAVRRKKFRENPDAAREAHAAAAKDRRERMRLTHPLKESDALAVVRQAYKDAREDRKHQAALAIRRKIVLPQLRNGLGAIPPPRLQEPAPEQPPTPDRA